MENYSLEKKIICDHLRYDSLTGMHIIDIERVAKSLYRRELLGFFARAYKSWGREKRSKKEIYLTRIKEALYSLIDSWNFHQEDENVEISSKLQDVTFKVKVYFRETVEFRKLIKSTGVVQAFYATLAPLSEEAFSLNVNESDLTEGQTLFFKAKWRRKKHWKQLKDKEKFRWIALAKVVDNAEKMNLNRYYKLAKDFYSFDSKKADFAKDDTLHSKNWVESHIPEAICIGMELENAIRNEIKLTEAFSPIFKNLTVHANETNTFHFLKHNPLHSDRLKSSKTSDPLVWNVYHLKNQDRTRLYLRVDRDIEKAVNRHNLRHFNIIIDTVRQIVDSVGEKEEKALAFLLQKGILKHSFQDEYHEVFPNEEQLLTLPLNYSSVLRSQLDAFLKIPG